MNLPLILAVVAAAALAGSAVALYDHRAALNTRVQARWDARRPRPLIHTYPWHSHRAPREHGAVWRLIHRTHREAAAA